MRDTTKKLIYAIEQQQIAFNAEPKQQPSALLPNNQKQTKEAGHKSNGSTTTGRTYQSVADQNFGIKGGQILPQLGSSEYTSSQRKLPTAADAKS